MNAIERFADKIGSPILPGHAGQSGEMTPCMPWVAGRTGKGYGQFWDGGRTVYAHRFAYETVVGPIPDGFQLDHLCRVRNCVNVDHLEPVTNKENLRRGVSPSAVHTAKVNCPKCGGDYTSYTYPNGRTKRQCRTCYLEYQREYQREWYRRRRYNQQTT